MLLLYVWDRQVGVGSMFLRVWKPGWKGQSGVQDFCFHLLCGGVDAYPQGHVTELQPMWLAGQLVHTSIGRFSLLWEPAGSGSYILL
jgi:hypothetical protein